MSRFYADISGGRGTATRQGHAASGIRGHVRGWHVGVKVRGYAEGDSDEFAIYATGGSGNGHTDRLLGVVTLDADGVPMFVSVIGAADSIIMDGDRATRIV